MLSLISKISKAAYLCFPATANKLYSFENKVKQMLLKTSSNE
jgi:hypothetical protein